MIISRESDYAMRVLRLIADGKLHNIGMLCESEKIPKHFGYKIIEKLQKADWVECVRGKYGGVRLTVDLHTISLFELLHIIDDDCYLNLCLTPGYHCAWEASHPEACRVHKKLQVLQNQFDETFQGLNLYNVIFDE